MAAVAKGAPGLSEIFATTNLRDVRFDAARFVSVATATPFNDQAGRKWVADHFTITLQASIAYVFVVFGTKFLMRNREPFQLLFPLRVWNAFLALFSIVGTLFLGVEFYNTLATRGLVDSYCKVRDFTSGENGRWVWLFIVSKLFELADTVFLVLRKKPLMFLHWYHHILTLVYAFYSHPFTPGFNRWGIFLNFFVHSFMYSYYFLAAMKIRVPGVIARSITTLQILQFVISCSVLGHLAYKIFVQGAACDFDRNVFYLASFMDATYLALFINFFLKAYVVGGGKARYQGAAGDKKKNGSAVDGKKKQ